MYESRLTVDLGAGSDMHRLDLDSLCIFSTVWYVCATYSHKIIDFKGTFGSV